MVVSMDFPFWIAAAEAPDPRCSEISDVSSTGYHIVTKAADVLSVSEDEHWGRRKNVLSAGILQPPSGRKNS